MNLQTPDFFVEPIWLLLVFRLMRKCIIVVVVCLAAMVSSGSEGPSFEFAVGEMVQNIACQSDSSQTYTLYIPSTYTGSSRHPLLLVFDPRGRSLFAAELYREAAERYGWIIVSSDNTRSDDTWEPNLLALQALWPEVANRIPADFRRIYAAGFSGTVAVSTLLAKTTGQIAGILGCGGLYQDNQFDDPKVSFFSTVGDLDYNFHQMHQLDSFLAEKGNRHRLVVFDGPHRWMPPEVAGEAVEWFELVAMQQGIRARDEELIESLYGSALERARSQEASGEAFEAARRFREMENDFAGLRDISDVKGAADRVEASEQYRAQAKEIQQARDYEDRCLERRNSELTALRNSEVPPPTQQVANKLHMRELTQIAGEPGERGRAAQRCLNSLYAAVSFYLPKDDLPKGRYAQVAVSYELANMIRDDSALVWYNLACVRAQLGQKTAAVEALGKSIDLGFNRYELLRTDPDLKPLRKRQDFKALIASLDGEERR
jgi:tetratricopeptide (TPR) repeat protein